MAVTISGNYYLSFRDMYKNDIALDWLADTVKAALFTNTITPNFDTDTAYAVSPYDANEVGTPSGGITIATTTITVQSGHVLTFDGDDTAWGSQTFSGAVCALVYDNTLSPKAAMLLAYFGGAYGVTSGIFTIIWPASGIHTNDLA